MLGSTSVMANSYHHQSVKRPAHTLRVSARADDGTVEGVETTESGRFVVQQRHPELLAAAHPEHAALFAAFVNAAEKYPEK
ncbi:MAG: gamma-glutamyl-gamma-aminobutyrate hydrolase family protein [Eubacteriales bacterium]